MRVLIAEDDPVFGRVLEASLVKWGHDVIAVSDGTEAWRVLQGEDPPQLAILDWLLPGMDGVAVCQRMRERADADPAYIILVSVKDRAQDIVTGLQAGADDYITKPAAPEELRARVQVGVRMLRLQSALADRVRELEDALSQVKQLQGLLPICSYCKKIRDDQNYWQQVEDYVSEHSEVRFTHSICPKCYEKTVKPMLAEYREPRQGKS